MISKALDYSLIVAAVVAIAVPASHPSQGDVRPVKGSMATLVTTQDGFFVNLDTQELIPGNVYTLWLVAINEPGACEVSPCASPDVLKRSAETQADVGYGGGIIAESEQGRFSSYQPMGELRGAWFGNGLQKPQTAEIHLVVRDHGPLLPDMVATMVNTHRGGCTDETVPAALPDPAKTDGEPGSNACRNIQRVIFVQEAEETAKAQ
jgi:hypothetical protein